MNLEATLSSPWTVARVSTLRFVQIQDTNVIAIDYFSKLGSWSAP